MDENEIFRFGDFVVNAKYRIISRNGETIPLTPKVFDTLLAFLVRPGHTITKEELMAAVWAERFVDESNLTQNVAVLRKALGDNAKDRRLIVTVPGRGYRFLPDVENGDRTQASPDPDQRFPGSADRLRLGREHRPSNLWIILILLASTALVSALVTYILSAGGQ